jgi:type III secretion protein V
MTVLDRVSHLAQAAAKRTDVIIVAFMLMAIVMMIIPLPTALVDVLIAINIALSILVLVVAFYIAHSVEFSALPPLILLSTLFRLALSITTTRLILLHGDAGHIVKAFGDFVIAGQVVVGLVVFLIITVAQFVVITKGAERVAEVAARFTLDAMPGKQMSIDNDLRNGDIDQAQARERRSRLERESQMFGAMDGAMKFVKGDAIAGLVILAVNLIGGMLIGMLERDMAFGTAVHTYSLLTVGDGLIAQIPALLISVAAGTVVTRVNSSGAPQDLGSEIVSQLGNSHRALALTAIILLGVSLLPGFPALVFLGLGAGLGGCAFILWRRQHRAEHAVDQAVANDEPAPLPTVIDEPPRAKPLDARVLLCVGSGLAEQAPEQPLSQRLEALCHDLRADLGIEIAVPLVHADLAAPAQRYWVELEGVPVCEGEIPHGHVLLRDDVVHARLLGIDPLEAPSPLGSRPGHWISHEHQAALQAAGIGFLAPDELLRAVLERMLRRYAADFLGIQETRQLLERLEGPYGELIKEAGRTVPLQRIAETLRLLVAEGVSIRHQRAWLEALVEWGGREPDTARLGEHLRAALARQISHQYADNQRVISTLVLAQGVEEHARAALRRHDKTAEHLPEELSRTLLGQLRLACERLPEGSHTVLLVHPELRRSLRRLCQRGELPLPVLSFRDLAMEYHVQAVATVSLTDLTARTAPAAPAASLANAS